MQNWDFSSSTTPPIFSSQHSIIRKSPSFFLILFTYCEQRLMTRLLSVTFLIYFDTQVVTDLFRESSLKMVSGSFQHTPIFFFFFFLSTSSFSDTTRCFRLILYLPCPTPRLSHFFKLPYSILEENGILGIKVWTCDMLIVSGISLLLGPFSARLDS